jgi:predicted DNA-binding transcriptional regulator AlpA
MPQPLNQTVYLKSAAVRARYGRVSLMWLRRRMADSNFPQPIRFGGGTTRFWALDAIEKWDRDQEAAGVHLAVNDEVQSTRRADPV